MLNPPQMRSQILKETGFLIQLIATNQDILRNPVSESDRNTQRNRVSN